MNTKASKWIMMGAAAVLVLGLGLGLAGCSSKDDSASASTDTSAKTEELSGSITVEGSDTMVNMSNAFGEAFQDANPGVMVSVKGGGSGVGLASLVNGTIDFANASREIKDEEKKQIEDSGRTVTETEVAKDGIAVIVNPGNGVGELTLEQVTKIYAGEITNWKDLGGADKKIVVLSRDSSSGTYEFFKEETVGKDAEFTKAAQMLGSNQAIVDEVSKNDAAVGYVGIGYVSDKIKPITLDGVAPSVETVIDKTYPLSRGLYMYSAEELDTAQQAFIDFILGDEGQKIVTDEGFVPLAG